MTAIVRRTGSGGTITLTEAPPAGITKCALCPNPDPIGLDVVVGPKSQEGAGRHLETALCADCLSVALAVHFGRAEVRETGAITDHPPA
jgi:hypothetical protein